jgi:hypothetical protein
MGAVGQGCISALMKILGTYTLPDIGTESIIEN